MVSEFRDDRIVLRNDLRGMNAGKTHLLNLRNRILSDFFIISQYVLHVSHGLIGIGVHDFTS